MGRPTSVTQTDIARAWSVSPLDMNGAASALGISKRTLEDVVKRYPDAFEWRGRKRVFYPEHISRLRQEMHKCGSKSHGEKDGRTSLELGRTASAFGALSELRTLAAQRKHGRR